MPSVETDWGGNGYVRDARQRRSLHEGRMTVSRPSQVQGRGFLETPMIARGLIVAAVLALTACGKQGPLYMPAPKPAPTHAAHSGGGPRP